MKRIYSYILLMVCGLLFASCQKEVEGVWTVELEEYQGGNGKIYLNDQYYACLASGDLVSMFDENSVEYHGIIELNGGIALLKLEENQPAERAVLSAIYSPSLNVGATYYEYESSQYYEDTLIGEECYRQLLEAPMVGRTMVGNGNTLKFYNLGAMVKIHIANNYEFPINLSSLSLIPSEGVTLTGIQRFNQQGVNSEPILESISAEGIETRSITFEEGEDQFKEIASRSSYDYYLFVPAGQTCAYTVEISFWEDIPNYTRTTVPITIPRSHMIGLDVKIGGETPPAQDGSEENN